MIAKYGAPQEVTEEKLVWHDQGPFKRINVTKMEHHHDFPKPHMDYMEHTVAYRVPADNAAALAAYDGSLTFDRTRGEMSARCDLEGHNILTLNLAHDIVTGATNAEKARTDFGKNVVEDVKGNYPPYTTALRFEPKAEGAMFADVPVMDGSPKRPTGGAPASGDAEILGLLGAVNDNEIVAAMEVKNKKLTGAAAEYAAMLHREHGQNQVATMMLGQKLGVTPVETPTVDALRKKGAGELAMLLSLQNDKFAQGYIDAMIKGHTEVIAMIDGDLLKRSTNEAISKHLAETRASVAKHLETARQLQGGATTR